jgi:hypothetical protein
MLGDTAITRVQHTHHTNYSRDTMIGLLNRGVSIIL